MKADYVVTSPGFGQGSIPLEAQRAARGAAQRAVGVGHPQRSGEDQGLGRAGHRGRPHQDRLAVRPRSRRRARSRELERRTASRCSTPPPATTTGRSARRCRSSSRRPARSSSRSSRSTSRPASPTYVITTDAYEKNFPDQFDFQVYVNAKGGVTPANTAAIKKVMHQYPGPKVADPRRVQGVAGRADQPVPEPGLRAAASSPSSSRCSASPTPSGSRSSNAATSSGCCARSA